MNSRLLHLPEGSERVLDADEEVFILYSRPTPPPSDEHRGLGYLDSNTDTLTLAFNLTTPDLPSDVKKKRRKGALREKTVEVELAQDKTSLRSRTGDTGSVVWKASVDFAQMILQQQYSPASSPLLDFEELRGSHILELGSGTGLLSVVLARFVHHYTATDIAELLPLIRKNATLNLANVRVEELNWETLHSTPASRRNLVFPPHDPPVDLILVVDCIYHPSLVGPLLSAIDHSGSLVLVVMELRADDVTRAFLEGWLSLGNWEIWRVEPGFAADNPYVMWVGWKI
ncbi:unnamed protein product [Mycena citricolor]|uniref:Uncharacterized protein n=1 Tax=Mycena citricolor TaxID=2018698 RepID=A0AAD2JXP3_9AGAR|nr:unnamed protein product [Mycena citricolor]